MARPRSGEKSGIIRQPKGVPGDGRFSRQMRLKPLLAAVNMAGSMASFLLATFEAKQPDEESD